MTDNFSWRVGHIPFGWGISCGYTVFSGLLAGLLSNRRRPLVGLLALPVVLCVDYMMNSIISGGWGWPSPIGLISCAAVIVLMYIAAHFAKRWLKNVERW
jgi:hypothetical protein